MNIDMTPRVTLEGDIILDLTLESSSRGADVNVGGHRTSRRSCSARSTTRLRLRDGESNLLAGLLREDERKSLTGFPGAIHVPVLKQLFSSNDQHDRPDRHRDAADAAHHPDARDHRSRSEADLHRIAAEPRRRRPAAADRARRPSRPRRRRRPPPPAPPAPARREPRPARAAPRSRRRRAARRCRARSSCRRRQRRRCRDRPGAATPAPPPPAPPPAGAAAGDAAAGRADAGAAAPPHRPPAPSRRSTSPGVGSAQVIDLAAGHRRSASAADRTPCRSRSSNASRLSTITLTLIYDPTLLRVRTVQEGSFMRSGGANATFTPAGRRRAASTSRSRAPPMRPARPAPGCSRPCCSTPSRPAARR